MGTMGLWAIQLDNILTVKHIGCVMCKHLKRPCGLDNIFLFDTEHIFA